MPEDVRWKQVTTVISLSKQGKRLKGNDSYAITKHWLESDGAYDESLVLKQ